jgi:hypothetical protein
MLSLMQGQGLSKSFRVRLVHRFALLTHLRLRPCRGISLRRYDEHGKVTRFDLFFTVFKVQMKEDGTFVDNHPTPFGRRVHYYSKKEENCPIFKHSPEVLEALTSKQKELIFKINPEEEGAELRKDAFESITFGQFMRFARPGHDMIPVGVYIRAVESELVDATPAEMPSIDDFTF